MLAGSIKDKLKRIQGRIRKCMKHLVARSYFRIITDDATGSSRSVSLRRTAKMASGHCRMQKWQELL